VGRHQEMGELKAALEDALSARGYRDLGLEMSPLNVLLRFPGALLEYEAGSTSKEKSI